MPAFLAADRIKMTDPSYHRLIKTELEMHRIEVLRSLLDADFIFDCNDIVGFSNRLTV